MGAFVVSEALRMAGSAATTGSRPVVNTYVASQGATWNDSYDSSGPMYDNDAYSLLYTYLGNASYFSAMSRAASNVVNYYNPVDYALSQERTGNALKINNDVDDYELWLNRYQQIAILSFDDTYPIGVSANVGGPFNQSKQIDLQTAFGFTGNEQDHSAEFMGSNARRYKYWGQLLDTMGISHLAKL
jgi:hypothetical protein